MLLRPRPVGASRWAFPDLLANPDLGELVGWGADLEPETLIAAYRGGTFPWPHGRRLPWFSPEVRAVLRTGSAHRSRSLRQLMARCGWSTTVDSAFAEVMAGCAQRREGTWITSAMQAAYGRLHELGWAHSFEVWGDDQLIGGLYGLSIGATFCAESMFHTTSGASKVAVFDVLERWTRAGGLTIDGQLPTTHLSSLGFVAITREQFLHDLRAHADQHIAMSTARLPVSRLARS